MCLDRLLQRIRDGDDESISKLLDDIGTTASVDEINSILDQPLEADPIQQHVASSEDPNTRTTSSSDVNMISDTDFTGVSVETVATHLTRKTDATSYIAGDDHPQVLLLVRQSHDWHYALRSDPQLLRQQVLDAHYSQTTPVMPTSVCY